MMMKSRQRGISLIGMILVGIFLACALFVGFKMVGPFVEFRAIKNAFVKMAEDANRGASESELRSNYERHADVDRIQSVKANQFSLRKQGGQVIIETEYQRIEPLVGNISLLFDFKVSSQRK